MKLMDWQNQNPYNNPYNDPYRNGNPYYPPQPTPPSGDKLAGGALVMGVLTVVSLFSMTVYPPFIFGSIGIVLALLSKGRAKRLASKAKAAVLCSTLGMIANVALVGSVFYLLATVPQLREQVNEVFEKTYGVTMEEMYDGIKNGDPYGIE